VSEDWKPALRWALLSSLLKKVGKGKRSSSATTKAEQDGGRRAQSNRTMPAEEQKREKRQLKRDTPDLPQMPRALKYAWGVGVTLLMGLTLVLDSGSAWMPLVHRAIDLLQNQSAPIENR